MVPLGEIVMSLGSSSPAPIVIGLATLIEHRQAVAIDERPSAPICSWPLRV
jgi:hypothetical protein